jgi:hypothetical protein
MNIRTAVIVATKDRPLEIANLLDALAAQTVAPDQIFVSACDPKDITGSLTVGDNVKTLFGAPGSSVQRNRALFEVRGRFDIVIFFDDDFVPSRFWIQQAKALFATYPDVICATGKVLADGVMSGGIEWTEGRSIVAKADASGIKTIDEYNAQDNHSPYGCNMAFRAENIEHLTFDERLILYGWLEDLDFSYRAGPKMVWTDAIWGVHLGTRRGRSPGRRFGYSQMVNPCYLVQKGTMTHLNAAQTILRALAGNAIGSFTPSSHIDRRGRLKGNIIAIKDILLGCSTPEKAAEL